MILAFDGLIFGLVFLVVLVACTIILLWTGSLLVMRKKVGGGQIGCAGLALLPIIGFGFSAWRGFATGPIRESPSNGDMVGTWICRKLPTGFTNEAGEREWSSSTILVLNDDGSVEATNFPKAEPYRYENFSASWALVEPGMTPTGAYSLSINGHFLTIGKNDTLKLPISVTRNSYATFHRIDE